ncbi:hypothetical protein BCR42DRAFT_426059 [Absidia repens]|uniref:Heterokaryon incompatibility domain-containing protein n=1 Tax=Absidia repens TaxID=90262 RepID=A0A1X2I1F8_9FUNG|nr:hypothetical protein BCR42DRAFT_426059 [Absidia repens]
MMTMESDLKHIKYVWVDAICVDQRPTKRKNTVYRMSDIYEKASFILAVPDLHLAYLRNLTMKNMDITEDSALYSDYIYYLIHGNSDQLEKIEANFDNRVPKDPGLRQLLTRYTDHFVDAKDPGLRQLLTRYTDHFVDGFMKYRRHGYPYCPARSLDHICEENGPVTRLQPQTRTERDQIYSFENLHHCHDMENCPLKTFSEQEYQATREEIARHNDANWKSRIIERSTAIRQSMAFLADLIKDWSSRVWVISEYSIAKKKNNLKYWFAQLQRYESHFGKFQDMDDFAFFKFDVEDPCFSEFLNINIYQYDLTPWHSTNTSSNPVYVYFHKTLIKQLNQQTFLEMILKSKASKNEDRFYSILPLSEYANSIKNLEVGDWEINTVVSVKLKLYEIMTIKDKLNLLFWSGNLYASNKGTILPTFATSTLPLRFENGNLTHSKNSLWNFDLNNTSTIMLLQHHHHHHHQTDSNEDGTSRLYYLQLKPLQYFIYDYESENNRNDSFELDWRRKEIRKRLGISSSIITTAHIDLVCIPALTRYASARAYDQFYIILVGSFIENKWTLDQNSLELHVTDPGWIPGDNDNDNKSVVFNIY